jgi:anaerobic selenocysteine-containing dehydrogenase
MATVVRGACPLDCPDTCAWLVEVQDGRVVSMRGAKDQPYTAGALCGKVNRYLDALDPAERLLHPQIRTGAKGEGRFRRASWDEALDLVAERLLAVRDAEGAEAILPYHFAGTMGLVQADGLGPLTFAALGASRLETTICTAAWRSAMRATIGGSVCIDPEDLPAARLILLWGSNPLVSGIHLWKYVLQARAAGAHVVCIDPLRSQTAERCDEHLAPIPGTDAALALGLMRAVLDAGGADRDWLAAHADGWPELEARLAEWPVERAAATCGLDVAAVGALGARLVTTRPSVIHVGLGLQRHGGAAAAVRAIAAIPAVTGDWRHVGGGLAGITGGHFPLKSMFGAAKERGLALPPSRTINMSRLGEALLDLDDPPVKALVVFDSNPAATAPDARRVRRGLERDDLFTVVLEQRRTDTADLADVLLPATMQPEHLDLHDSYGHLYLSWNEPAVEPPGECLPNSEIFRRLAARLGLGHPLLAASDVEVAAMQLETPALAELGVTVERLRADGFARVGYPRGTAPFAAGGFPTANGKVHLRADELVAAGQDPLVGFVPPVEVLDEALAERFPLVLVAPAARFFLNSTFAALRWHRAKQGEPTLFLHPDDAGARGIADGDPVRVFNDRGTWQAAAVATDATRRGVCFTYKVPWAKLSAAGENVNAVTPERDTDLGGGPTFHDNRVEVCRV